MPTDTTDPTAVNDDLDRITHQRLCAENGPLTTFPQIKHWAADLHVDAQKLLESSCWLVVDKASRANGIPFKFLRWTRQRIRFDNMWDDRPRGQVVQFPTTQGAQ